MPFRKILKELAEKSGAEGAAMLAGDGEVVAIYSLSPALEMDLIGAHHGIILNIIKDAEARAAGQSILKSVSISTDRTQLAISTIKDGYYLVAMMGKGALLGRALFESSRAVKKIEAEMG